MAVVLSVKVASQTTVPTLLNESGRFRGVTPLSWPALEGGNPDISAGRCSPTLRQAPEFVARIAMVGLILPINGICP